MILLFSQILSMQLIDSYMEILNLFYILLEDHFFSNSLSFIYDISCGVYASLHIRMKTA